MSIFDDSIAPRPAVAPPPPEPPRDTTPDHAEFTVPETIRTLPPAEFFEDPLGAAPTIQTDLAFFAAED